MIRKIREHPELKDTPVIAASASVYEGDHQKSMDSGADDFLPKQLYEMLQKLLNIEWLYEEALETGNTEFAIPPAETLTPY